MKRGLQEAWGEQYIDKAILSHHPRPEQVIKDYEYRLVEQIARFMYENDYVDIHRDDDCKELRFPTVRLRGLLVAGRPSDIGKLESVISGQQHIIATQQHTITTMQNRTLTQRVLDWWRGQ